MNNLQVMSINKYLKELSIYTKNLIVYKSLERGKDRVHIKSFQEILKRKIEEYRITEKFFNSKKPIVMQLLNYFISCGEIIGLGNGYYAVLPIRYVYLTNSRSILALGKLKMNNFEKSNFGLAILSNHIRENTISLEDYRYDISMKNYMSIFQNTKNEIKILNEKYYKPTKSKFIEITHQKDLKDNELYYIISQPFEKMNEHYIARKMDNYWLGEKINKNLFKSKLALLVSHGYSPSYEIKKIDKLENNSSIFQITLSDFLPKVEREQVYLFSLPRELNYCKQYFVQKKHLKDFLHVLSSLEFIERNDGYDLFN